MPTQKIVIERLLILTLVIAATATAAAGISLQVYDVDGVTPFDCNSDTMVGSKLTLVISSDSNDYWSGGLFIKGEDRALGTLAGRDKDPNTRDWTGSHLENAGDLAKVTAWRDSSMWGFDLYTYRPFYPFDNNMVDDSTFPGDWFVIDYYADEVGECNVGFYEYNEYGVSWKEPNYQMAFIHSPTRDLNADGMVNFGDFVILASKWNSTNCSDPNWCAGADIDRDGDVDHNDLGLFVEYWLWPTAPNSPNSPNSPNEPDDSNHPEDPNITYSIVDANGLSEITLDVNESVTLYVDIATTEENNVYAFYIEVDISDTNLGSIDNTEYPDGTAQILAEPNRDSFWDYWGPGVEQEEGIRLFGLTTGCPIVDGHLASFVFTCTGEGDVTLNVINWYSYNTDDEPVFPKLEPIVIHQVDPNSQ